MTPAPQDKWVAQNQLRLHYRDWGGSGQPVVLVHGLASTCHIWDLVAPILSKKFRVVALDQRGHGESDKPDHGYDFATVADDLQGLIEELGMNSPLLVGHSWGADVALELAVRHPSTPKGLCFVDGGTIEVSANPEMTLEVARREMAPPDFTGMTVEQLMERSRSWQIGPSMTPQMQEIVLAHFEVLGDKTVRARLSRDNHMRIIDALWEHRPSTLYSQVGCPVLMMPARQQGDPHPLARRLMREESLANAQRLLPRCETVWLEDSVHDVPLQRPQLVASVIADHVDKGFFS